MKRLQVKLKTGNYPIYVTQGIDRLDKALAGLGGPFFLITNPRVYRCGFGRLRPRLRNISVIQIPDGERFKNLQTVQTVYRRLVRYGADRHARLLLLGGGVVGDLGGYVAATYLRGVPFVQIPTTLVAQVDSSIGGKVGVDLSEGKNLVGAFYHPRFVYADVTFLETLPERQMRGGLAEVLKYGVIRQAGFFRWVIQKRSEIFACRSEVLQTVVATSAGIKAEVVSRDERESHLRMILNFGHTFGHALERMTRYRRYTHGEAVAIGMVIAARLSRKMGYCDKATEEEIREGVRIVGLPSDIPSLSPILWLRAIGVDKKRHGGKIRFVFVKKLGEVVVDEQSPERLVRLL